MQKSTMRNATSMVPFLVCGLAGTHAGAVYSVQESTCGPQSAEIFERAQSADNASRLDAARSLYMQATDQCDRAEYWQALGDLLANDFVGNGSDQSDDRAAEALEAYGYAFTAARRKNDSEAGATAARAITELGLSLGDPLKANDWLLVAGELDPTHADLDALRQEVDFAREEISSAEIETGLSPTRGVGRVNSLLAGGVGASAYWDSTVADDPTVNQLVTDPLHTAAGGSSEATIALPINFESNSIVVTDQTSKNIANLARVLAALPPESRITLTGHADARGDESYNLVLSRERAAYVSQLLISLEPSLAGRVSVVGKGESEPVDSGDSDRAHANNRRLEVTVSG